MWHWQKPQNKINAGVCAPPWVSVDGLISLNSFSSPVLKDDHDTDQQLSEFTACLLEMSFYMIVTII